MLVLAMIYIILSVTIKSTGINVSVYLSFF